MIPRIEFLINQVRFNSDSEGLNFSDQNIMTYFNDGQKEIQNIIFQSNVESDHFSKDFYFDLVKNQADYTFPADTFCQNSINSAAISTSGVTLRRYYKKLPRLQEGERGSSWGYTIINNIIKLMPAPSTSSEDGLRINYVAKVPDIGFRWGQVASSVSGVSVTISGLKTADDISAYADYFCVVDKYGSIKEQELEIDSYTPGTGVITTTSTFAIAVGDYVIAGNVASSHIILPDPCQPYLMRYVERRMMGRESRSDLQVKSMFSEGDRDDLIGLFQDNSQDPKSPPIFDTDYTVI